MGMFNTIKDELHCPFCGTKNKEFQTKDLGENLIDWNIEEIKNCCDKKDIIEIYDKCKECKEWISINLDLRMMKNTQSKKKIIEKNKRGFGKSYGYPIKRNSPSNDNTEREEKTNE